MGLSVKSRTLTTPTALMVKEMPRQNARRAIPERDLGWPGKKGLRGFSGWRSGAALRLGSERKGGRSS